jgi:hypothetical protein
MRNELVGHPDVEALAADWQIPNAKEVSGGRDGPVIRSVAELATIRTYASQPIEFVVDDLIAVGTVTAITGESGGGKSTFISALCGAIDRGVPFAGQGRSGGPFLYLTARIRRRSSWSDLTAWVWEVKISTLTAGTRTKSKPATAHRSPSNSCGGRSSTTPSAVTLSTTRSWDLGVL